MQLKDHSWLTILFFTLFVTQLCSCAGTLQPTSDRSTDSTGPQPIEEPTKPKPYDSQPSDTGDTQTGPRAIASLELTAQGKNLLSQGQPDGAIRLLERAVQLNPTSGQNYYYLAEAWIMKKNLAQAREFNDLAQMYFADDPTWLGRAEGQRKRIESENRE